MHAYGGQGFMVNNHHPTEGGARGRSRVVIVNNKSQTNMRYDAPTGKLTRYIGMLLANMECRLHCKQGSLHFTTSCGI